MSATTADRTQTSGDVVRQMYDAIVAGDLEGVLAVVHEDLELHEPPCLPYGGVYKGRSGFQNLLEVAGKVLDGSTLEVQSIVSEADRAMAVVTLKTVGAEKPVVVNEEYIITDGLISTIRVFMWDPTVVTRAWAHAE